MYKLIAAVALVISCQSEPPVEKPSVPKSTPPAKPEKATSMSIDDAIANQSRPSEDRARDEGRKPAAVLRLAGVSEGMTVVDLMTGRGYYAEILAHIVGKNGTVYAQNNAFVVERFADEPLRVRLERLGLPQLKRLDAELEKPGIPADSVDVAMMVLFYHDTYWQKTDRAAMNRAIHQFLKPGGVFVVVDHHAKVGAGDSVVKTLHRVEASLVKQEILRAGFELVESSTLLANPADTRELNVFDDNIRGRTDRFVFKFRKPEK